MNSEWAQAWCDAMSSGDADRALKLYAPMATFEDVPFRVAASGDDVDGVMRSFVGSGTNSFTFASYSGDAHGGALEWTWRANHEQDFLDTPAAGRSTEVRVVTVMSLDDEGLITRHCDYWDARTVLTQLRAGSEPR
jgi:steroid delta-isomerase-like uncharacterized protein